MADVAAVRLTNIISVTQGTSIYRGVRSVTIRTDKGKLLPILGEGQLYPTGAENVGSPDFPVQTEIAFEQDPGNAIAMLGEAVGSLVIVFKQSGGGANKTVTIANHQFKSFTASQNLQDFGKPSVQGIAFAAAGGTALPIGSA